MIDIADTSGNAILRPGKVPRWRAIFPVGSSLVQQMYHAAKRTGTFGADIEIAQFDSTRCCGAIFVSYPEGRIPRKNFWQLEYFFDRDGAEALVFEYDRFQDNFVARRLDNLRARAYFRA